MMSRAAWEPRYRAKAHSAFCGHPGFVPDEYLAGLSMESTITENTGATWITRVLTTWCAIRLLGRSGCLRHVGPGTVGGRAERS